MFFRKVGIKNFKGIATMDLVFQPGINLLLGENGTGKTTILEAMTIALGDFLLYVMVDEMKIKHRE